MKKLKIISYNLNGIRAAIKKGLIDWVKEGDYDIIMLQETKAHEEQVDLVPFTEMGYESHWCSAEKKGYSGVATFTRIKPDRVIKGMKNKVFDAEGRLIRLDFGDLSVLNAYFPSGSSGEHRQEMKMKFLDVMMKFQKKLRKERPNLILSGDYNIAHKEIDIHNPKSNKKSSGFLPEERAWMDKFFQSGWTDVFREFNENPHEYSWWSYRAGARGNNKGWRIDYHAVTNEIKDRLVGAQMLPDVKHSDHCPILMEIKL